MVHNLALLSAGERDVLEMLADGHTAKSVAAKTGLSVAAVNERLRSARRKTGVGSSRELARQLRLQENCALEPDKIGLSPPVDAPQFPSLPSVRRFGRKWVMSIFVISAAVITAVTMQQIGSPPPTGDPVGSAGDPLLGEMVDPRFNISTLHSRLRNEGRDDAWAERSEAVLRVRYAAVPNLSASGKPLRVMCRQTLCEVAGLLPQNLPQDQNTKLFEELQSDLLRTDLAGAGLESKAGVFGRNFVMYWTRVKA